MRSKVALAAILVFASTAVSQEQSFNPPEYQRVPSGLQIERLTGTLPGAATGNITPRPILQVGLDIIKVFEGWFSSVYNDPVGYCTIGYGHLIAYGKCENSDLGRFKNKVLTEEEGNQLLADDTRDARITIQSQVNVDLSKQQFAALASFVFNVGSDNFTRSTALKVLNHGDYEVAANELLKWTRAKGIKLPGLVIRRNCEVALFNGTKLARLSNGKIDLKACGSALGGAAISNETIDVVTGTVYKD